MTYNQLIAFLDGQLASGQLNPQTVVSRRASVVAMLRVATDEELQDVAKIDIDDLTARFQSHVGDKYKAETIKAYRSRLETTVREYLDAQRLMRLQKSDASPSPPVRPPLGQPLPPNFASGYSQMPRPAMPPLQQETSSANEITFPIPLRENVVVYIKGLPRDLTKEEAAKISRVIMALTIDEV